MKKLLFAALAATLLLPASAQIKASYTDVATVSGEYEAEFVPDEFYLSIRIEERDSKGRISLESKQRQMLAALETLGIDRSRLKIADLSSDYYRRNANLAAGRYELKLDKAEQAVAVQQALDRLGISQVRLDRVDRSDRKQLEMQGLAEAQRDARARAEALMSSEGRKVGKCFHCTDGTVRVDFTDTNVALALEGAVAGVSVVSSPTDTEVPPLEFRNVKLSCRITASFVLE